MAKPKAGGLLIAFAIVAVAVVGGFAFLRFSRQSPPNVVVVLLDTLRADHLGAYGHERPTTPNIDAFARRNVTFMHAYTAAPWTPPSVASIFTGLYLSSHGMAPPNNREQARSTIFKLNDKLFTMAELLKAKGYRTAAVSPNPWINTEFGYAQGFDHFSYTNRADAGVMTQEGIKTIEQLDGSGKGAPWFAYVHYLDPHAPYAPPDSYKNMFNVPLVKIADVGYDPKYKPKMDLYDAEVRYMDDQLKVLFDYLATRSDYDDTLIVIVGDHGEQFGERGHNGHGFDLFNEETHVPLIIKPPGREQGRKVEQVVSTIDILPTVLELTGGEPPAYLPGVSLFNERALDARRGVMTEIRRVSVLRGYVNSQGKKLIVGSDSDAGDLTVADDPTKNVIGVYDSLGEGIERTRIEDPGLLRELQSELYDSIQLALSRRVTGEASAAEVNDATIEQLKSLGYLK